MAAEQTGYAVDSIMPCMTYSETEWEVDPPRTAILLTGGSKTGNNRWYEEYVPRAEGIYDRHLRALEAENKKNSV